MALYVNDIPRMFLRRRPPEVSEADVIERRRRLETRDMPAQFRRLLVGAQDRRDRVPADDRTDLPFDLTIPRRTFLLVNRNRVNVRRVRVVGQESATIARFDDQILKQEMRPIDSFGVDYRLHRVEPFAGLNGINILR